MTIKRGEAWGELAALPDGGIVVHTDAEAAAVVQAARDAGEPIPPLGLAGGDLCRTLGGRGDLARLQSPDATRVPIDLGLATIDGREHVFVAHLVARRSWWVGPIYAAMNAQWIGRWNVAPAGHPNDGRLDIIDIDQRMSLGDRRKARRRLPTGRHVPHPKIATSRLRQPVTVTFGRPLRVWLDGRRVGRAAAVTVTIEPDSLDCYV